MGAVYAGCFYVLMDTKQPASRLQQILGILDSAVIVTSEKYLKDLEKLEFKGKVLMAPDLAAEQENEAVLNEIREQALDAVSYTHLDVYKRQELGYEPYVITIPDGHSFVMINGLYYDNMYGTLFGAATRPAYTIEHKIKF